MTNDNFKISIDESAKRIIDLLMGAGYKAYVVGGCVRDALMGREISDTDITTSALPKQTEDVLNKRNIKCIETGLKHGTVTAVLDNKQYEITTFRTDGEYKDSRHPESVTYVDDIAADLARRDFTMNAIAYNDSEGFVDPYGGIADIDAHIIRAVGEPNLRFKEDALRIMRAVRFASVLGFEIEDSTEKAVFSDKALMLDVSGERIYTELKKLLCGDNVFDVLIKYRDIIAVCIPEIVPSFDTPQHNPWHIYDVYTHIAKTVEKAPNDAEIRLVMLLHDIGKPSCRSTDEKGIDHFYKHPIKSAESAKEILNRFKVSNSTKNRVITLVRAHDGHILNNRKSILTNLHRYGESLTFDLIDVKQADMKGQNLQRTAPEIKELDNTRETMKSLISSGEAYRIGDLKINGNDLINSGYRNEQIGENLENILKQVISGQLKNDREYLLKIISEQK